MLDGGLDLPWCRVPVAFGQACEQRPDRGGAALLACQQGCVEVGVDGCEPDQAPLHLAVGCPQGATGAHKQREARRGVWVVGGLAQPLYAAALGYQSKIASSRPALEPNWL